jgi:hypothetical protein
MDKKEKQISKGYAKAHDVFETELEIALICGCTQQAVHQWKYRGIPKKRRTALLSASGGKIKTLDQLRG